MSDRDGGWQPMTAIAAWVGFRIVIHWPDRWRFADPERHIMARVYWAALPWAGEYAYREERAVAKEPRP